MDIGQMMAVMQQMSTNVPAGKGAEDIVLTEQSDGSAFAGLLKGLQVQNKIPGLVAGQGVPQELLEAQPLPEVQKDVAQTLQKISGNTSLPELQVATGLIEKNSDNADLKNSAEPELQNAMMPLNMVQLEQMLVQLNGRMPEIIAQANSQGEAAQQLPQAISGVTGSVGNSPVVQDGKTPEMLKTTADGLIAPAVLEKAAPEKVTVERVAANHEAATVVRSAGIVEEPIKAVMRNLMSQEHPRRSTDAVKSSNEQQGVPVSAAVESQLLNISGVTSPVTIPQKEATITEGDNRVRISQLTMPQTTVVTPGSTEARNSRKIEVNSDGVRSERGVQSQKTEFVNQALSTSSNPQKLAVVESFPIGTENRVLQLDQPEPQQTIIDKASSVRSTVVQPQLQALVAEPQETPVQPAESAAPQEVQQKVRVTASVISPPPAFVRSTESVPENVSVHAELHNTVKSQPSEQVDTAVTDVASSAPKKNLASMTSENSDQSMPGDFQSQMLQHQVKKEAVPAVNTISGPAQSERSQVSQPAEQVVQQVRDRFVNHEAKPGSEQIVLRLSPEHLGELKVNINLDGQRLKVEIVAENRMVRDSLMQHTDSLKESLSRQNIKMESFEVTTGGNGTTDGGRSQSDWRELAHQRQQNTWMPEGGYRLAKQVEPAVAAYQLKPQHTMVDLHY